MPCPLTLKNEMIPPPSPPPRPLSLSRSPSIFDVMNARREILNNPNIQRIVYHDVPGSQNGQIVSRITLFFRRTDNGEVQRVREEVFNDGRPTTIFVTRL